MSSQYNWPGTIIGGICILRSLKATLVKPLTAVIAPVSNLQRYCETVVLRNCTNRGTAEQQTRGAPLQEKEKSKKKVRIEKKLLSDSSCSEGDWHRPVAQTQPVHLPINEEEGPDWEHMPHLRLWSNTDEVNTIYPTHCIHTLHPANTRPAKYVSCTAHAIFKNKESINKVPSQKPSRHPPTMVLDGTCSNIQSILRGCRWYGCFVYRMVCSGRVHAGTCPLELRDQPCLTGCDCQA